MFKESQKQMMCFRFCKKDSQPTVVLEKELYSKRVNRRIFTHREINIYDKNVLLRDLELKEWLGYWLLLGHTYDEAYKEKEQICAHYVYPHFRNKTNYLRIDQGIYHTSKNRTPYHTFSLPDDTDALLTNEDFKQTLAEKVINAIPISETLCRME